MATRDARALRLWLLVLTVVLAAWTLLGVADGVAWADSGKGSSHSETHDAAKPSPPHHRTKASAPKSSVPKPTAAAPTAAAPATDPAPKPANDNTVAPAKLAAVVTPAAPAAPAAPSAPTPKTVKLSKIAAATTPVSAVSVASSPHTPSTPSTPLLPDSATVAALGEEVQRRSTVSAQLTPGYLINSVVNNVGAALAGTAAHLNPGLANDIRGLTQFTRQMVGLGSDVGVIVASLVSNIATQAAQTVGRYPLWGLPYNALNVVATIAGDVSKVFDGTPLNATSTGRFIVNYGVFNALGFLTPWVSPPGANDPSITVTAAHPLPIILLNGTSATQDANWGVGAPALANAGYKVYTFNYGNNTGNPNFPIQAIGDVAKSAQELSDEINKVLTETGAPKVILIGHSQGGGIMPEYYLNNLGGAAKVSQFIGIAPSNHGTTVSGLTGLLSIPIIGPLLRGLVAQGGAAWLQQAIGSSMVQQVYGNGDTRPGVIYDTITSVNDEVVTPYTQQALNGPNVTNVIVQQQDPGFFTGHVGIVVNYTVWQDILGMLASNPAASPVLSPVAAVA